MTANQRVQRDPERARSAPAERGGSPSPVGLADLGRVELGVELAALFEHACSSIGGSVAWRARKCTDLRDLLALCQLAPHRIELANPRLGPGVDLRDDFQACIRLKDTPVPCRPDATGPLVLAQQAVLIIHYPEAAMTRRLRRFHPVHVLSPAAVWHANVGSAPMASAPVQPLCLGPELPVGIRLKELVLLSYRALTMQDATLDEFDSAGVMNAAAAQWWQAAPNRSLLPLSTTPFLAKTTGPSALGRRSSREVSHETHISGAARTFPR